ncbi:helix-turn-helix domain-containing protein [Acidovorax sp. LjRoot129]|uniref:helix-turn-helix domain-containing protein n=1 Tax=Acidovorax sp. LjRoot129 TaxID=3342260 RepID=UPI003F4F992A
MPFQRPPTVSKEIDPRRSLGLRVKELRAEYGLTQEDLADRSGLFRTYLSRIESGQANPTLTVLYQVAAAFPIGVIELLTPATKDDPPKVRSAAPLSRGRVKK